MTSIRTTTVNSIVVLLEGCRKGDRMSQELLYRQFYGFAMGICMRYTRDRDEAMEVLNDGFMKVFTKAELYDPEKPFKAWLKRIMVNTALDFYRQNVKHYYHEDIETAHSVSDTTPADSEIGYEELMGFVQKLSPAYRTVFCLFAIDGYSHEEVAESLNISVGTSKSNLARAREQLRKMLKEHNYER
ncbi:MAG: sigma-70 family RNA polymerase sigma factor [Spirosomataceae bacterium]